jgi:hypothetical protein
VALDFGRQRFPSVPVAVLTAMQRLWENIRSVAIFTGVYFAVESLAFGTVTPLNIYLLAIVLVTITVFVGQQAYGEESYTGS